MRIYFSVQYVAKRALLFFDILFLLFALFPYESVAAHNAYLALTVVFALIFAANQVVCTYLKKKGLERGLPPDVFSATKSQAIFTYMMLILFVVIIALPFYIIIITSFKTINESSNVAFTWWPKKFVFDSYVKIFEDRTLGISVFESFLNTLWTSVFPTLAAVFISTLSAYAFAKLEFRGKGILFGILLMTMMMPGCVTLTASYLLYDTIGWTNSFLPLIIPSLFGGASIVFFLRQYIAGIPDELFGSAKIDGLGKMGMFMHIVIPLSLPAIIAQIVLTFVGKYNDYMGPLIYLQDPETYTLQIVLRNFLGSSTTAGNQSLIAAACVVSVTPLLLIYLGCQKTILSGIALSSGLKG